MKQGENFFLGFVRQDFILRQTSFPLRLPRFGEGGGANLTLQLTKELVFFQIRLRTGLNFLCTAVVDIFNCSICSFVVLHMLLSRDGSAALPTPHQTGKSKVVTQFSWSRKFLNVTLDSFK
ncbi:hypothetical protein A2572_04790 [Candidatus Collierbacteria bacterium RIFOXYD1_FULL_40_9]|uniref:Uncharacterized protein n=1 Tax=Candidatus Collierbacteria bacterium RIFOXYD1_FULL_40_9 TaxID=1817731 RepID=A0A1F5FVE1_9BACT|nr:MAG: hypothetical protein A2572_04790 [Candidatus Collierbacteria bacterium RIFOXYD1_FULL_40_9]